MSKVDTLPGEGLRSELLLQQQLRALSEAFRQQLQETERRQTEELERRIHQNALLSTEDQESVYKNEHNHQFENHCSDRPSMLNPTRAHQCKCSFLSKTTQMRKEEEAEAECKKKFSASPAPSDVIQPLYLEMMEMRENKRRQGREQRKNFLLTIQKPFNFQEREREKREKLIAMLNQVSQDQKNKAATVRKPRHKVEEDFSASEVKGLQLLPYCLCLTVIPYIDMEKVCKKFSAQSLMQQDNPASPSSPKLRTAERTRKKRLGFLDEKPDFHPKISHQVPDFSMLHKALQTEGLRKTQSKDVTKCQPFYLRTSALPARRSKMSPENTQEPTIRSLSRSKSLGTLTSLSTDTLPTYITDAARKRCMAIRKSMEIRESKNQESAEWFRKYEMKSQAMKKTVILHAKLLDPHSSLNEMYNEKLQHHREADQQRMREYMKELREMKSRVNERPYLFQLVKQRNAKAHAEQTYRNKLKKAGLREEFVEENGDAGSTSFISEDNRGVNDSSTENDFHSREENVDDWEKIEDVEDESVKSKGEEMA
ncbi:Protein FAM161B [Channa argus]|uniref:Protein FAM161B n=1 Tax=Channa argus TaxID=215402 RepID=A0A6G1QFC5_CHAAH|nr:Protein FAM161B [Channa argus]